MTKQERIDKLNELINTCPKREIEELVRYIALNNAVIENQMYGLTVEQAELCLSRAQVDNWYFYDDNNNLIREVADMFLMGGSGAWVDFKNGVVVKTRLSNGRWAYARDKVPPELLPY